MRHFLKLFRDAYHQAKEIERKRREYTRLVGADLSYTIIRELIQSAVHGVVIDVTLKDGTKLEMRREDPLDAYRKQQGGEFF